MIKHVALGAARLLGHALQTIVVACLAVSIIALPFAIANYSATQGSGTTFASVVLGGTVHYFANMLCDFTAGQSQCAAVDSSGNVSVKVTNATTLGQAAMASSSPVTLSSDQAGTCTLHSFVHITSATDTLAVQGVTAQKVYLCAWVAQAAGTATWYWENTASTNANCSSTLTQIGGLASMVANNFEITALPYGVMLNNTSANGLCIKSTGTGGVDIDYWYAQR